MTRVLLIFMAGGQRRSFLELRNVWLNMLTIPGMNTFGYDGELTGKIDYQSNDKNELGIQMDIRQMKIDEASFGNTENQRQLFVRYPGTIESDLSAILNDTSSLTLRSGQEKILIKEISVLNFPKSRLIFSNHLSASISADCMVRLTEVWTLNQKGRSP